MQEEALVMEKSSVVSVRKTMFLACKRTFDIFCSLIGLIMLLPVFLIVSIIIKIDSRGPVFLVELVKMVKNLIFINLDQW